MKEYSKSPVLREPHLVGRYKRSTEMQLVYSAAPADVSYSFVNCNILLLYLRILGIFFFPQLSIRTFLGV